MSKIKLIVEIEKRTYELLKDKPDNIAESIIANGIPYNPTGDAISREALQGEYKTACNVLLSLEQIVRSSDGWEDSAVEAVHNAVQTAIKCMHDIP